MTQAMTQIQCPNCKAPIMASIEQLIDVGQDPGAKARLLSGSINRIKCPSCGFEGQIATPLVYHDPEKELLLTYMPVELSIPKDEQERVIGKMINKITESLPPEQRKAYLFQPQTTLTMQGMLERILEEDGISKEEIEEQRARMRLFEDLIQSREEDLDDFIKEHDEEMDSAFFQIAAMAIGSITDADTKQAVTQRYEKAVQQSKFGRRIQAQENEFKQAIESINELGKDMTRENILDLLIQAPNDDRVLAIVNLLRPALDYSFFQLLTDRMESSDTEQQEKLSALRERILEISQEIDKVQEARAAQAASLLQSLIRAEDLDQAIRNALPIVDDYFLGILQANIQAAEERNNAETLKKLNEIRDKLQSIAEESVPEELRFAQQLINIEDDEEALRFLETSIDQINDQVLSALMATADRLAENGDQENADRVRNRYRQALRLAMKAKMSAEDNGEET
ncbi:MAG: CpXC domain-containing protein [Anaerolineales bacterium]